MSGGFLLNFDTELLLATRKRMGGSDLIFCFVLLMSMGQDVGLTLGGIHGTEEEPFTCSVRHKDSHTQILY